MSQKPTHEQLLQRIQELEQAGVKSSRVKDASVILLDASDEIAFLLNTDLRLHYANNAAAKELNMDKVAFIGKKAEDILPAEIVPSFISKAKEALQSGKPFKYEDQMHGRFFLNHLVQVYDANNAIMNLAVYCKDITAHKNTETRLYEELEKIDQSNELMEIILSSTPYLLAYMDRNFNFVRVNKAYAEAGRRRPEDFIGQNHFHLYPHEENERIFRQVVESGETYSVKKKPFNHPDQPERGTTYWDWSLIPVNDKYGRVQYLLLSLYDVTNHKHAEDGHRKSKEFLERILHS